MPTPARTAAAPTQPARHGVLGRRGDPRVGPTLQNALAARPRPAAAVRPPRAFPRTTHRDRPAGSVEPAGGRSH